MRIIIEMEEKFILDACCGGRQFWFDKEHKNVLYVDKRVMKNEVYNIAMRLIYKTMRLIDHSIPLVPK